MTDSPTPDSTQPMGGAAPSKRFSQAETMIGLGAGVVVADFVIFQIIQRDYSFDRTILLAAIYALAVLWIGSQRPGATWHVPRNTQLRVAGYLVFVGALVELIIDLRLDLFDRSGGFIAGAIVLYVGGALAAWGAKQLD
jgi:hypothetical protein